MQAYLFSHYDVVAYIYIHFISLLCVCCMQLYRKGQHGERARVLRRGRLTSLNKRINEDLAIIFIQKRWAEYRLFSDMLKSTKR
jgi:hypothetical protein